jgi:hypothetical protein
MERNGKGKDTVRQLVVRRLLVSENELWTIRNGGPFRLQFGEIFVDKAQHFTGGKCH